MGSVICLYTLGGYLCHWEHPFLRMCLWWSLWGGFKGVINFPWIFYAMWSLVPVGHFQNISRHLFSWLVCWSFQLCHGLLFTDCIVWDDRNKVIGLQINYIESTQDDGVLGFESFDCFNYHSIHTSPTVDWYLLDLTFDEYDIKMQNAAIWRFLG